jgi:glycogen operon protein
MKIWPGSPYPLGATYDGGGTNFALFSEAAERVELCLFDDDGKESRIELPDREAMVWHGYLPRIVPGQRYGYRVHGPYDPGRGVALQSQQVAPRSVREGDRRADRVERGAVLVPVR